MEFQSEVPEHNDRTHWIHRSIVLTSPPINQPAPDFHFPPTPFPNPPHSPQQKKPLQCIHRYNKISLDLSLPFHPTTLATRKPREYMFSITANDNNHYQPAHLLYPLSYKSHQSHQSPNKPRTKTYHTTHRLIVTKISNPINRRIYPSPHLNPGSLPPFHPSFPRSQQLLISPTINIFQTLSRWFSLSFLEYCIFPNQQQQQPNLSLSISFPGV